MRKKIGLGILFSFISLGTCASVVLSGSKQEIEAKTIALNKAETQPPASFVDQNNSVAHLSKPGIPTHISIPAVNLQSVVIPVGIDKVGNMDVPSGKTTHVGWFKYGVLPGDIGTAVFDAHVFAAFTDLDHVRVGDDIFIGAEHNDQLHFKVISAKTYALNQLSPSTLFGSNGTKQINLITCAGSLTADRTTYTHRLIVSAVMVEQ